jgi:tetratricopeptide (TPR) repeat protein
MKTLTRPAALTLLLMGPGSLAPAQGMTTAQGMVLDQEGNPIPEVQVLMNYKGHVIQRYRTKTDKKGKFVHVNVYAGVYDLTLSKPELGEAVFKDFTFRDLDSTEKLPVFRLGVKKVVVKTPEAASGGPGPGTADAAAVASAEAAGLLAVDLEKANAALKAGQLDDAIAGYDKVAAGAPNLPEVHHNLGLAWSRKGDKAKAEAALRKAIELKPGFADSHRALSVILYESGKRDAALQEAVLAAQADPANPALHYTLGVMYADSGKGGEAHEALLRAEALDPANAEIQYQLGTVAVAANQKAEAIARLEKYLSMAPPAAANRAAAQAIVGALKK